MKGVERVKLSDGKKLMIAIKFEDIATAKELLTEDPNLVNFQDQKGNTPLHLAYLESNGKNNDLTELLSSKGADRSKKNSQNFTVDVIIEGYKLLSAIGRSNFQEVQSLLKNNPNLVNFSDFEGSTPLHQAAYNNNLKIAQLLLENKAIIDAQNINGDTPLHNAVLSANTPHALNVGKDIIELLITNKADPNICNNRG